ncbi:hypothetical protein JTB14_035969 [Gonioctena quinquepunctata]|nr:hypothetical protein JTB14_035969 [Gonioctena quinquepunctata]
MNALLVTLFATLALTAAAPSGIGLGWGGLGLVAPGAVLAAPTAGAVISGPIARGAVLGVPSAGAIIGAPGIIGAPIGVAGPIGVAAPGAVALTRGGGAISVSGAGAVVSGPPTAPATIVGPSGTVRADGLWGPTLAGVAVPAGHGW